MSAEVISDFDGSITDMRYAANEYEPAFSSLITSELHIPISDWEEAVALSKKEIQANPGVYGWQYNGLIIAPATVDPTVFYTTVSQMSLVSLDIEVPYEVISRIHAESFKKVETIFKPGAKNYLLDLHKYTDLAIVTNSKKRDVELKLQKLLGDNDIAVIEGRKYEVDNTYEAVPLSRQPKNFPRPVLLRRRKYDEVLSQFKQLIAVIGDIYEIDLALPEEKGVKTVLIASEFTPKWEYEYYQHHHNGFLSADLEYISDAILSNR